MKQTAMIRRDGFETFYFDHTFKTGVEYAKVQFDKLVKCHEYRSIQLFNLNTSPIGDKWVLVEEYIK